MNKLAKVALLIFVLNGSIVFASRIDQGSTSEGTAFQSGTTTQCTSSTQTNGAPCLQWSPNGQGLGLVGAINSEAFNATSFSPVTNIYVFASASTVMFTPSNFTDLAGAEYGVANCGSTGNSNSNVNIFTAGGTAHVPCVDLTAIGQSDADIVETLDGSGNSLFKYTGNTLQNIVFYVKYDSTTGTPEGTFSATQTVQSPEPASAMLFVTGLGSLLTYRRKRS